MFNATRAYELNILVKDRPVTEYAHEGNIFIEGRKGSEFELEFKNKTGKRVLVVPSVDGKSIFTGERATPESRGYVVSPWGSIRIPGWTLNSDSVAKFTFEDKEKSYSALTAEEGEEIITGVIGVMVYDEVAKPVVHHVHHYPHPRPNPFQTPWMPGMPRDPYWTASSADAVPLTASTVKGLRSMTPLASTASMTSISDTIVSNPAPLENPFEMGAGFGDKADFKTQTVDFTRGELKATMEVYYDSRRNLEKRGIEVVKKEVVVKDLPSAFAGGCKPPKGWQG